MQDFIQEKMKDNLLFLGQNRFIVSIIQKNRLLYVRYQRF